MFCHRLAWQAGELDVDVVKQTLSREQIIQWMAYLRLEPPAADRADVRDAFIAAKHLNQLIREPSDRYTVKDLMIDWTEEPEPVEELTPEEKDRQMQAAILSRFA